MGFTSLCPSLPLVVEHLFMSTVLALGCGVQRADFLLIEVIAKYDPAAAAFLRSSLDSTDPVILFLGDGRGDIG